MLITEKKLTSFCILTSIAGIAVLFFLALTTEPPSLTMSEARQSTGKLRINGIVMSVEGRESYTSFQVAGHDIIDVISFNENDIVPERLQEVEITGEARQFKGKPSIIATKVKPIGKPCNFAGVTDG